MKVRSKPALAALEAAVNDTVPGTTLRRESSCCPDKVASVSTRYILPQVVSGGGWIPDRDRECGEASRRTSPGQRISDDGSVWNLPANPRSSTRGKRGTPRYCGRIVQGSGQGTFAFSGWIEVSGNGRVLIEGYIAYGNTKRPPLARWRAPTIGCFYTSGVFACRGGQWILYRPYARSIQEARTRNVEFVRCAPTAPRSAVRPSARPQARKRVGHLFDELLPAVCIRLAAGHFCVHRNRLSARFCGSTNGDASRERCRRKSRPAISYPGHKPPPLSAAPFSTVPPESRTSK